MHIYITGGTGFIGGALQKQLLAKKHQLTIQTRTPKAPNHVKSVKEVNSSIDAVINLAGAGIADKRWTAKRKQELLDSRIKFTEQLIQDLAEHPPKLFINASANGYYGVHGDEWLDEGSEAGEDFGAQLCQRWERAARTITNEQTRLLILRFGVVIGPNGGFIKRLLPMYKLGMGGRLGDGQQWLSWIALPDLLNIIEQALDNDWQGVINASSPNPVRQAEFNETFGELLHRPTLGNLPRPLLQSMFGEMSLVLWGGQRVCPRRLQQINYRFQYPHIRNALKAALQPEAVVQKSAVTSP